jgi:hypothetical protein
MSAFVPDGVDGRRVLSFAWASTVAFALTAIAAAIWPTKFLEIVALIVALVAFAIGLILFLAAYFRAIGRSRYEQISVVGVYLLMGGVAPQPVRRSLLGALALQIVVALSTASARPYSSLAFGVLVPLLGVALCGWWSAAHGVFPERVEPARRRAGDDEDTGEDVEEGADDGEHAAADDGARTEGAGE